MMEENPLSESFPDAIDSFNAELPKEVPCLLTDIIVVRDTIIVVDNENKKVKRFTRDKQIQDYVGLEDPCGVAKLELSSHLVVTEPLQRQITFIDIEDKMTVSSYRRTRRRYQSVCCLDEMRIVVGCCDIGYGALDILNYEGIVISSVEFNSQGGRLFRTPASLASYPDGNYILISDAGHRKLICMNPEGGIEFIHDPKGIPSGMSVNDDGALFLCLYDKNSILQLNANCDTTCDEFIGDMNLKSPLTVCSTDNLLFITEEMPSSRVVVVNLDSCSKKFPKPKSVKLSHIHVTVPSGEAISCSEGSPSDEPTDVDKDPYLIEEPKMHTPDQLVS